jgi:hypothetical protein
MHTRTTTLSRHSNTGAPTLAARFGRNTFVIRSDTPLAEDQMRRAAPSIFATAKHVSRSDLYTYIPTIEVLRGLRREGFEPCPGLMISHTQIGGNHLRNRRDEHETKSL